MDEVEVKHLEVAIHTIDGYATNNFSYVCEKKRQKKMLLDASDMSQTNINSVIQISEGWPVIWMDKCPHEVLI